LRKENLLAFKEETARTNSKRKSESYRQAAPGERLLARKKKASRKEKGGFQKGH